VEHNYWTRVGDHVGHGIDSSQLAQLTDYRDWLVSEALPVGGIGPAEAVRIDRRHIADSLLFAAPMEDPAEIWDLGSGAGLPGIPLAILFPRTSVVLIDRSSRSADLIDHLRGNAPTIVSRAALPPEKILLVVKRHLDHQGVAIVGGSWTRKPSAPGWETLEIPRDVLDHTVWLLIMRPP